MTNAIPNPHLLLQEALVHHQAGRLAQAAALYEQVLIDRPAHERALHLLGVLAAQSNQFDKAVDLMRKAITINPANAEYHRDLAVALHAARRFDEAITVGRRAIELRPDYADAYRNLGLASVEAGKIDEAIGCYKHAIRLRPDLLPNYFSLGFALRRQGRFGEAVSVYRAALKLKPDSPSLHNHLGAALTELARLSEASHETRWLDEVIACFENAVRLKPDYVDAQMNLGIMYMEAERNTEALRAFDEAVRLRPDHADAHINRGVIHKAERRLDEAMEACLTAIRFKPDAVEAYNNLGLIFQGKGRVAEALETYRKVLAFKPDCADTYNNMGAMYMSQARPIEAIEAYDKSFALKPDVEVQFNRSLALLLSGDLARGWPEMEVRWRCKSFRNRQHKLTQPQWRGEDFDGRTLLLHAEQGLGDSLQTIRFLPLVAARGGREGRVIVNCPESLLRLFRLMPGPQTWNAAGEALPKFDLQCPFLSVPMALGITLENIPRDVPYLQPDAQMIGGWRTRLAGDPGLKVGIVWAGNPEHTNDRNRSLALGALAPLALPGVTFYSLQKGPELSQAANPPAGMTLINPGPDLHDFADTAGLIANLDLVIGVDTSVVHLAGAMGKPVWTLLPFACDWRWLVRREDTPWYPTMRLIRQQAYGDWKSVIDHAADLLRPLLKAKTAGQ